VTLDLQNADLRDTLRMLAQQTKANLTFGDDVQGRVTATLHDMALEPTLDSLLKPLGLTWRKTEEGVYVVETGRKR